jgi:hypothetical protein
MARANLIAPINLVYMLGSCSSPLENVLKNYVQKTKYKIELSELGETKYYKIYFLKADELNCMLEVSQGNKLAADPNGIMLTAHGSDLGNSHRAIDDLLCHTEIKEKEDVQALKNVVRNLLLAYASGRKPPEWFDKLVEYVQK